MEDLFNDPLWNMIISGLVGGVIGLFISRIFDKPLERWQRKIVWWLRTIRSQFQKLENTSHSYDEFCIGKWRTSWVIVEGSSSDPYAPNNVICQLDPRPIVLPPDREQRKDQIEREQSELEMAGEPREYHNGPTIALAGMGRGQIGYTEEPFLVLRLRPSVFYNYLATTMCLDELVQAEQGKQISVRDHYLHNLHYESPIPEFVGAFAISLSVITSDGFIVLTKRGRAGVAPYGGYIYPAINECINPVSDRSASGTLSLFTTAQRGASHELNIEISEDELEFLTLGVDTRLYSYLLTGIVRTRKFTRDDIIARRTLGSKERWETEWIHFLPHDLERVARFMRDTSRTEKWSPLGIVCLIQTLILEFGARMTESALNKYPPYSL
jgi:hypothetical protein